MKKLIICPVCKKNGKKQVLGELKDGHFVVERYHKGGTRIVGNCFGVVCDNCGSLIYIKKGGQDGKNLDFRSKRIRWTEFSQRVVKIRPSL